MATYRISGVWKNKSNLITHYCFHKVNADSTGRGIKLSKVEAIVLVENQNNTVTTWLWDYSTHFWLVGSNVHVVQTANGKFLRSTHDETVKDNLDHLIDYDWLSFG